MTLELELICHNPKSELESVKFFQTSGSESELRDQKYLGVGVEILNSLVGLSLPVKAFEKYSGEYDAYKNIEMSRVLIYAPR